MINLLGTITFIFAIFFTLIILYYDIGIPKLKALWVVIATTLLAFIPYYFYIQFLEHEKLYLLRLGTVLCLAAFFSWLSLTIPKRMILISFGYIVVLEILSNLIDHFILSKFNGVFNNENQNIIVLVTNFSRLLLVFLSISLSIYYKLFKKIPLDIKKVELKGFLYNLVLIISICSTNIFFLSNMMSFTLSFTLTLVNIFFLVAFILVSIINLNTYVKVGETSAKLELQIIYNNTMQSFVEEIGRIKHNYNNTLMAIGGYIKLKKWDKLQSYLFELSRDFDNVDSLQMLLGLNIKNAAILGLLNSKMTVASQKGLTFNIENKSEIKNVDTKMYALRDVLGSLIDFSINCSFDSNEKYLKLEVCSDDKDLSFILKNSCSEGFDETKIFEKNVENSIWFIRDRIKKDKKLFVNSKFSEGLLTTTFTLKRALEVDSLAKV